MLHMMYKMHCILQKVRVQVESAAIVEVLAMVRPHSACGMRDLQKTALVHFSVLVSSDIDGTSVHN